ncbi:MAG: hypothetical protein GX583_05065 [Thermoplasmatales archaeon]|jgi:hypothetical protein|nr:hypothetical protein [Thermoplasmatales archaeon]
MRGNSGTDSDNMQKDCKISPALGLERMILAYAEEHPGGFTAGQFKSDMGFSNTGNIRRRLKTMCRCGLLTRRFCLICFLYHGRKDD